MSKLNHIINVVDRKCGYTNLQDFEPTCTDTIAFIEITEWANGVGYDIRIERDDFGEYTRTISLTIDELEAIKQIINILNK